MLIQGLISLLTPRAWIPEPNTRPIDSSLKQMNLKRTQGWNNANKELMQHQEYVKQGNKGDVRAVAMTSSGEGSGKKHKTKTGTKRKRQSLAKDKGNDGDDGDYVSSLDAGQVRVLL